MLNQEIQDFARQKLKTGLAELPDGWQLKFKRMYAGGKLNREINDVVDSMPQDKLSRAMEQVEASIRKINEPNPS